jgi:hemolysin D
MYHALPPTIRPMPAKSMTLTIGTMPQARTFDFTRFGYIEGTVQWVGTDAVNDPKLGPVYPVRIQLSKTETPNVVNGLHGAVSAGMSVSSDIRTGERRMIEYFIAPMLRYKQESLRER